VPKGLLDNRNQIAVSDSDGRRLPVQTELLGTYPGGLPRWVFLQFSTSLGAQSEKSLKLEFGPTDEDGSALVVVEEGDRICVETGAVSFSLRRAGFSLPNDLTLGSTGPILHEPSLGFRAVKHTSGGTKEFFTGLDRNTELTVVEKGPVRAVVHYSGKHGSRDGSAWLDYDVWVSATLDSPIVSLRYRVMNQEENPMDGGSSAGLEEITDGRR
jgi:hypothetical protein